MNALSRTSTASSMVSSTSLADTAATTPALGSELSSSSSQWPQETYVGYIRGPCVTTNAQVTVQWRDGRMIIVRNPQGLSLSTDSKDENLQFELRRDDGTFKADMRPQQD